MAVWVAVARRSASERLASIVRRKVIVTEKHQNHQHLSPIRTCICTIPTLHLRF